MSDSAPYEALFQYIDGEFIGVGNGPSQPVFNPADDSVLGQLPRGNRDDVARAIAAAERAFRTWRHESPLKRSEILRRAAGLMRERAGAIGRNFTLDQGKADALTAGQQVIQSLNVQSADGTANQTITVNITGSNDAAVITGSSTAALNETNAAQSTGGNLDATDVDSSAAFVEQSGVAGSNGYGSFSIDASGAWTYTMNDAHDEFVAGPSYTDSVAVATADGTQETLTVTIAGTADGPVAAPPVVTGTGDANDFDGIDAANVASAPVNFSGAANNQDTVHGSNSADNISGNGGADSIYGNGGDDTLNGGDAQDAIYGGSGIDTISGGNQNDRIFGGSGSDVITGNDQQDEIYGGSGNDAINGGAGNDALIGGYGADQLTGGVGGDTFVFLHLNDTGDTISDFAHLVDKIDLAALDAGTLGFSANTTSLTAHGVIAFYDAGTGQTIVQVDTNGDTSTAELQIQLTGNVTLTAADFTL